MCWAFRLGTSGSDDGAFGLGTARAFEVGELDVDVGSASIVQISGDGETDGSSCAPPWCSSPFIESVGA